ncbi:tRNA (adenine22-N1)-methyltransferase [Evansella caseinilytica]|uniref:tRNA (Adenine22-N1)-methyltransferase n=1 Tax=Evansella caseinilytica TaxID=1503961 RepID=A0A1H3KKP7_9BACI|nr:tRNA (adenine(22)-N(1))-methyltransferase TrmK [Evansella caseinilytica]SDY52600.1 tRNA (adenine22-N1)-methyltransferase [Evansella caseinilytica]
MNEQQLSKRLEKVVSYIRQGDVVADIGSDHAYLPVYLIKHGIASRAIAGEVNEGPLRSAEQQVAKHSYQHAIKTKLGNGLAVLEHESVDTIVIAGMGGPLITQILDEGKSRLEAVSRLILQPNIAAENIREWLLDNHWRLIDECILKEDGHYYEIVVAEKGAAEAPYQPESMAKQLWLGPLLLKEKTAVFKEKWLKEKAQLQRIYQQLDNASSSKEIDARKQELAKKIAWLEEELA